MHNDHIGADGVFKTCSHKVRFKQSDRLHIIPLGDIHSDAPSHCEDAWRATLDRIRTLHNEGTQYLLLGMGDYVDFASTTERSKLARQGELHESTHASLDKQADQNMRRLAKQLEFTKGHWIGWIQGNHYWRYLTGADTGKTTSMMLAEKLGGVWLGSAAYIVLTLQLGNGGRAKRLDIFASHGKSGGQLLGTPYNNVHKMRSVFPGADIYLMGHDHNRGTIPKPVLECRSPQKIGALPTVHAKRQIFGRTGSFLRAYDPSIPNYVVKSLMHPADLGHIEIVVKVSETSKSAQYGMTLQTDITCLT
jgi:hypothetical protein